MERCRVAIHCPTYLGRSVGDTGLYSAHLRLCDERMIWVAAGAFVAGLVAGVVVMRWAFRTKLHRMVSEVVTLEYYARQLVEELKSLGIEYKPSSLIKSDGIIDLSEDEVRPLLFNSHDFSGVGSCNVCGHKLEFRGKNPSSLVCPIGHDA